jgi:hypothetical protein
VYICITAEKGKVGKWGKKRELGACENKRVTWIMNPTSVSHSVHVFRGAQRGLSLFPHADGKVSRRWHMALYSGCTIQSQMIRTCI